MMPAGASRPGEERREVADTDAVRSELRRLLSSDQFKNSKRCGNLLSYIVEESLAGRSDQLKERLIGVHVFGRDPGYDTASDPVVRTAAIEMRRRLAQFYVETGRTSDVRIDLHAGTYRPDFVGPPTVPELPRPTPAVPAPRAGQGWGWGWILVAVGVACLGAVLLRQIYNRRAEGDRVSARAAAGVETSHPTGAAAAAGGAVRILVGTSQSGAYVDRFGDQWMSDRYYAGGTPTVNRAAFFFPPADPELFRTFREGTFSYDIPLDPSEKYEMRLYFSEPSFRYRNEAAGDGESKRLFDVTANGQLLLHNFDIISDSGFAPTTIRAFRDITPAQDGKLHLQFTPAQSTAVLSAIELIPMEAGKIAPIRLHAGPSRYLDQAGERWSPDNFYIGGELYSIDAPTTGTPDPDIYKVERIGNFHYAIPVPPGRYSVTLDFAETYFHDPGARVFDVSCNGVTLLRHLDILREAGYAHALQKTFHGLEPNGQGKLLISFSPVVNSASVRAIEVVEDDR